MNGKFSSNVSAFLPALLCFTSSPLKCPPVVGSHLHCIALSEPQTLFYTPGTIQDLDPSAIASDLAQGPLAQGD